MTLATQSNFFRVW